LTVDPDGSLTIRGLLGSRSRRAAARVKGRPSGPVWVVWLIAVVAVVPLLVAPHARYTPHVVLLTMVTLGGIGVWLSLRSWHDRDRRLPPRLRRAWLAMALALVTMLVSGVAFAVAATRQIDRMPPGGAMAVACVSRGLFAIALLVAIFSFPGPRTTLHEFCMRCLDLLMVLGCGAMATWYFLVGPALLHGGVTAAALLRVPAPLADLALVGGTVLTVLRGVSRAHRRQLYYVIAGVICLVPVDLGVVWGAMWDHGRIGFPISIALLLAVAGLLMLVLAAAAQVWQDGGEPAGHVAFSTPGAGAQLPYVAVLLGYLMLIFAASRTPFYPWGGLALGTIVMTSGMLIRQVLALREQRRLATTDPMTGLANRTTVLHGIRRAQLKARRTSQLAAVLLFDLDGFKRINDTLGHSAGDALLTAFAAVLRRNVLGSDLVGRLGGDEFVVVLHSLTDAYGAVAVAERVLGDLTGPILIDRHSLRLATSVGITVTAWRGDNANQALHRADLAMYEAKRAGGNVWRMRLADHQPVTGQPRTTADRISLG
jgi:diguanylate cyclase (GGDEF)-like protein